MALTSAPPGPMPVISRSGNNDQKSKANAVSSEQAPNKSVGQIKPGRRPSRSDVRDGEGVEAVDQTDCGAKRNHTQQEPIDLRQLDDLPHINFVDKTYAAYRTPLHWSKIAHCTRRLVLGCRRTCNSLKSSGRTLRIELAASSYRDARLLRERN